MLEILQLYVSGFWVWLGITIGMVIFGAMVSDVIIGLVRALRPVPQSKGDR